MSQNVTEDVYIIFMEVCPIYISVIIRPIYELLLKTKHSIANTAELLTEIIDTKTAERHVY